MWFNIFYFTFKNNLHTFCQLMNQPAEITLWQYCDRLHSMIVQQWQKMPMQKFHKSATVIRRRLSWHTPHWRRHENNTITTNKQHWDCPLCCLQPTKWKTQFTTRKTRVGRLKTPCSQSQMSSSCRKNNATEPQKAKHELLINLQKHISCLMIIYRQVANCKNHEVMSCISF